MRCQKCGFVSFDPAPACKKCGHPTAGFTRQELPARAARPKRRRVWVIVNGALLVLGIGAFLFYRNLTANRDQAIRAADQHFALQDRAAFHEIYATASPVFRGIVSEEDFTRMMHGIATKLGRPKDRSQAGWRSVTGFSGGPSVILQYQSQFEKGEAFETLTFVWDGTGWRLLGYHINSPALLSF
jgi:hypothetical protein